MARHEPSIVWALTGADLNEYVRTDDEVSLLIVGHGWADEAAGLGAIRLDRRRARLLAKRINECLDATR